MVNDSDLGEVANWKGGRGDIAKVICYGVGHLKKNWLNMQGI